MKPRRRIFYLLLGAAGIALLAFLVWRPEPEPSYQGKTLSEWVEIYERPASELDFDHPVDLPQHPEQIEAKPGIHEAIEAVRHMRDQVIPRALVLIRHERPLWKRELADIVSGRLNFGRWCPSWIWRSLVDDPGYNGACYFYILGDSATSAIPQLEAIASDPQRATSAQWAIKSLAAVGTNALPTLARVATSANEDARLEAMLRLRFFRDAAPAATTLLKCLKDPNWRVVEFAAEGLGDLRVDPDLCVTALTNQVNHASAVVRTMVILSLGKFGAAARPAVPAVLTALGDPDVGVRTAATNTLQEIAPEALEQAQSQ